MYSWGSKSVILFRFLYILFNIINYVLSQERNSSLMEKGCSKEELDGLANEVSEEYSKDDGFPDVS